MAKFAVEKKKEAVPATPARPARVTLELSPLEAALIYKALGKTAGHQGYALWHQMSTVLTALDIDTEAISRIQHEHPVGRQVMDELIPDIVRKAGH